MNKFILILTCGLLGFAPGMAQQRKMADVRHIADSILSTPSRWGNKVRAKAAKTRRIIAASELLDGRQDAFYVCDAGDGGFAVVSADERMTPVLGFSQADSFDPKDIPAGMRELLNSYAREYEALTGGKPISLTRHRVEGVQEQVGPLLSTEWGQNAPFNNKCPEWQGERCITGCVAVTSAQTMRYYQYPDSAKGKAEYTTKTLGIPIREDLAAYKFDWPNMRSQYSQGASNIEKNAVADLLYTCAVTAQMDFGLKGSSASSTNQTRSLVENFGYDSDIANIHKDYMTTSEWQRLMLNELNAESPRPVIYAAISPENGGHSFILDGYKADEDGYPFYHINWGWEGYCNDYFKLSSMDADGWEFSKEHEAIIFIQPENNRQDNGFFCQAQEVILSSARIKPGTTRFTATLKFFNYSYKAFSGVIKFYLRNELGEEFLVGTSQHINKLSFVYGLQNFTIQASLSQNIPEEDYTVILRSKADNSQAEETVTYPSPQILTVTSVTESYTPDMMIADLQNVGEDLEGYNVSLRAVWPMNRAAKAFTGTLRMAVADENGENLIPFGQVANISNMEYNHYISYAYTFKGELPDYLEDGAYRLYLAANQSGYLEWGKVTQWSMTGGAFGSEVFIPFWLEDGKIIYNKNDGSEEDLPDDASDIQVTEMTVTAYDSGTRRIDMQMSNILNMGNDPFAGKFSMVVCDKTGKVLTNFGEPQKMSTPMAHFQSSGKVFSFSGNLPEELESDIYTIKIASQANGCKGWTPIRGWVRDGGYIIGHSIELGFDFVIMNNRLYQVDTDGLTAPADQREEGPVYNLNGQEVGSSQRKGIYIIAGKKVVR